MDKISFHALWIFLLGFLVAYYWRSLGDMTVGKIFPAK